MISSILVFLIVLSVLVLVHELGHFLIARRAGVLVEEFGFGLPPRVWGKKIGKTLYSVNLLPFGGFVKLHGENIQDEVTQPKKAFVNKSKKARVAIISAGVFMNFFLAIIAFSIVYSFSGIPRQTDKVSILEIATGSPAQVSGFHAGDVVEGVEEKKVSSVSEFIQLVDERKGEKTEVFVKRKIEGDTVTKKIKVTPRKDPPKGEGPLGVVISSTEIYYPPLWKRPFVGIYYGFQEAFFWGKAVIVGFANMFFGLLKGRTPSDVAGPVGIFAITSKVAAVGTLAVINFIGVLSVNLAILNIIPFPALDGGRLLFIAIEGVVGKRVLPKIEAVIHTVGMIILLLLLFAITVRDIQRLISAGSLSGFLESVLK